MTNTPTTLEVPVAEWFDPQSAMRDPYPQFERLRALGPVVNAPVVNRVFLTTHAAVAEAEHRPEIFSSYSETNLTMVRSLGGRPMLRKDDPSHAAERSAINPTLRPRAVTQVWSPRFEANVERWIGHLLEVGPADADLNRDFAAPLASQNLIDLLGFPADVAVEDMRRWSTSYIAGIGNLLDDPEIWRRADQSQAEVNAVLDELLPRLRTEPNESITSHLLQVGLSEEIVRANVQLTISGGMNEPQHMITNLVWALSMHPDQRATVLAGEVNWGDVFEETARWQSPIGMVPREVAIDTEIQGTFLPAGTNVGLLLASANRDTSIFSDADRFDVHRTARGHLAFGSGVHMCAGRWAAKDAIAEHALPRLYERIPGIDLAPDRSPSWDGWVFRGITELPITW
ncbi:cytochrome P450 [Leucobacter exalbidus]|uniref:Cytochrome P450 n=1 Tax=Leucobacter exalbidus TaxID=662960 RepID=A0A940PWP0_9MICO|nr:cytochrome P450 [Leucobacter exalbidus]MBP1326511.1 cytochrome P450 [Leucobacter exalbidus]